MKKKLETLLQRELDPQSRILIISPHLDDSVFSLGGLIYLLKDYAQITVVNVFSSSNYCHDKEIDSETATKIRKEEDQLALFELGINKIVNLDFKEALLRGHSRKDIFLDRGVLDETDLIKEISLSLKPFMHNNNVVIAPSAFGSHVDHLLCREATKDTPNVLFYEDLPYANRDVRNNSTLDFLKKYQKAKMSLGGTSIEKHLKACLIYKSQILERHYLEIREFISTKGISLWKS